MFDFAKKVNDMPAIDVLNYYRNLYYAEPQVTERGIVANAINDVLDIISRQKAEIENAKAKIKICAEVIKIQDAEIDNLNKQMEWLTGYNGNLINANTALSEEILLAKTEAYKEFAERLKEEIRLEDDCDYNCQECCYECSDYVIAIDNLLKEMVGEENNRQGQHSYVSDRADEK